MSSILPFENKSTANLFNAEQIDYQIRGFIDAGKVEGTPAAFSINLENFYSTFILNAGLKKHNKLLHDSEIEAAKKSIDEKIEIHKNEIKNITEKYIPDTENELNAAESTLHEFKINPSKFIKHEKDYFMLWGYGILSLLLAAFLLVFYSSVVYSAFFRDITITKYTLFNSIFYPKAFEEAFYKGFAAFIITILAPFVFMALGIIIDNLKEKTQPGKLNKYYWFVIVLSFIFDALLAFHISERINNSKAINTYGTVKTYTLSDAIFDLNFWMIIAFGFAVYLIFGKVFSLFNEERKHKNSYYKFESALKENINELNSNITLKKNRVSFLENEINTLSIKSAELYNVENKVFFSVHEINKILSEYTIGWIRYLKNAGNGDDVIEKIETRLNSFINQKGLNNNEI